MRCDFRHSKVSCFQAQKAAAEAKKVTQPVKSAEVTKPTVTEYVFKHPVGNKKDVSGTHDAPILNRITFFNYIYILFDLKS